MTELNESLEDTSGVHAPVFEAMMLDEAFAATINEIAYAHLFDLGTRGIVCECGESFDNKAQHAWHRNLVLALDTAESEDPVMSNA